MRNIKKLFAALLLTLALGVPVFACGDISAPPCGCGDISAPPCPAFTISREPSDSEPTVTTTVVTDVDSSSLTVSSVDLYLMMLTLS